MFAILLIRWHRSISSEESKAQKSENLINEKQSQITHGPYIIAPTETSVTITWKTDGLAVSKIKYRLDKQLKQIANPQEMDYGL